MLYNKLPYVGISLSHLEPCDWQEFSDHFQAAYSFLLERSLDRELQYLQKYPQVMLHSTSRLDELRAWKANVIEIRKAKQKLAEQIAKERNHTIENPSS